VQEQPEPSSESVQEQLEPEPEPEPEAEIEAATSGVADDVKAEAGEPVEDELDQVELEVVQADSVQEADQADADEPQAAVEEGASSTSHMSLELDAVAAEALADAASVEDVHQMQSGIVEAADEALAELDALAERAYRNSPAADGEDSEDEQTLNLDEDQEEPEALELESPEAMDADELVPDADASAEPEAEQHEVPEEPRVEVEETDLADVEEPELELLDADVTAEVPAGMVLIPAGAFIMGSAEDDPRAEPDERPAHEVWVDAFYLDEAPVTNQQYREFVEATGHRPPETWEDARFGSDMQPVVGVSWEDAVAFAEWAEKRLPTEAEWEKAARAGLEGTNFPWGDDEAEGRACFGRDPGTGKPDRVKQWPANDYGVYDMAGLVWEWCSDWFVAHYYANSEPRNPQGPGTGSARIVRGGAWNLSPKSIRCAYRRRFTPNQRSNHVGFRCAKDVESE
jgi:iron(II)-dependent oxidoreductase